MTHTSRKEKGRRRLVPTKVLDVQTDDVLAVGALDSGYPSGAVVVVIRQEGVGRITIFHCSFLVRF